MKIVSGINLNLNCPVITQDLKSWVHVVIDVISRITYCIWVKTIQKTFFFDDCYMLNLLCVFVFFVFFAYVSDESHGLLS